MQVRDRHPQLFPRRHHLRGDDRVEEACLASPGGQEVLQHPVQQLLGEDGGRGDGQRDR